MQQYYLVHIKFEFWSEIVNTDGVRVNNKEYPKLLLD